MCETGNFRYRQRERPENTVLPLCKEILFKLLHYEVGFTKKFQNFSKTIIRPNCAIFDARDVRNELYSSLYLVQMTVTFVLVRLAKFRAI